VYREKKFKWNGVSTFVLGQIRIQIIMKKLIAEDIENWGDRDQFKS
jgi:hypothetical protein